MSALSFDERLHRVAMAARTWRLFPNELIEAIDATVQLSTYPREEVEAQLLRIVGAFTDENMRTVLRAQAPNFDERHAPLTIAHVAAATIPGLAIESLLWGLVIGSTNFVRASRDERSVQPFVKMLLRLYPDWHSEVFVVSEIDWDTIDAAIVYGSDETVSSIQRRLPPPPRIAAFGSRSGVAIVDDAGYPLGHDIACFDQRGCMSPTVVLALGDDATFAAIVKALQDDLRAHTERRLFNRTNAEVFTAGCRARSTADTLLLDALLANTDSPMIVATELAAVHILHCSTEAEVAFALGKRRGSLQSIVIGSDDEERFARIDSIARLAGATRTCSPGHAHEPERAWPHDGIGHIAPLLRPN